ncbi:MAG: Glu-tRNA(Gln) amidotransferase subunit GatE [archaeon]
MQEEDYQKLGFKCGLEIHQQLDTNKLFCSCPSVLRQDEPDYSVERKLHAIAGESGEIDTAVGYEISLNKKFIYQGYNTNCLVELDEEPPHEINKDSLRIALQIAILLKCKIFSATQIMRKTVINGSNTSGFQRTVLIAKDGFVETSSGKVKIESICLEEDATRIVEKKENETIYRLDRLGIPLVEITTAPDIKTPEQAKEAALYIGDILRSCKVKRGLGTIRQDVNISIKDGNRVELKGIQDMKIFVETIKNEVKRQLGLAEKKKPVSAEVRNALSDATTKFLRPMPGAERMYPETDLPLLKISRDFINEAKKTLPKMKSDLKSEFKNKGLNQEMIKLLFKRNKVEEFKEFLKIIDNPNLIAKMFLVFPREIASKKKTSVKEAEDKLEDYFIDVLNAVKNKKISDSEVKDVLDKILSGVSFDEAIKKESVDLKEIEEATARIVREKPGLTKNAYMGLIMKEFKGKISGKDAAEIIKRLVK